MKKGILKLENRTVGLRNKNNNQFFKNIEAKAKVTGVAVLMIAVALSSIFVLMPQNNTVKAASTTDFDSYQPLTIESDYIDSTLTNFPVLVYNSSWETGLNSTTFSFFQSDNSTECNWELEEYNPSTGELIAWVNVSSVSNTSDTTFYLYYDDTSSADGGENSPTGTWDSNYVAVYHMVDISDSTVNSNDATSGATAPTSGATGKIGDCYDFNGSSDFLYINETSGELTAWNYTMEIWFKVTDVASQTMHGLIYLTDILVASINIRHIAATSTEPTGILADAFYGATKEDGTNYYFDTGESSIANGSWYYGAYSSYNGAQQVYLNDTAGESGTQTGTHEAGSTFSAIGFQPSLSSLDWDWYFDGLLDEVRISNNTRNASWVNATFHSTNSTTGFLTFGDTEGSDTIASSFSLSGLDGNERITWSGEVGETVWSNASSYGTLTIQTNINATDNCTAIYLDIADFDSVIDADNISVEVRNTADGTFDGTTTALGTSPDYNLTINASAGAWFQGTNPFPMDGAAWTNITLEVHFTCAMPNGAGAGTYLNTSASWNVLWKVET